MPVAVVAIALVAAAALVVPAALQLGPDVPVQRLWEHADMLLPGLVVAGLCVYTGFPHKHRRVPSMESVVFAAMGGQTVIAAMRLFVTLWSKPARTSEEVFAALVFFVAGLVAVTKAFPNADQQGTPPDSN